MNDEPTSREDGVTFENYGDVVNQFDDDSWVWRTLLALPMNSTGKIVTISTPWS